MIRFVSRPCTKIPYIFGNILRKLDVADKAAETQEERVRVVDIQYHLMYNLFEERTNIQFNVPCQLKEDLYGK